MTSTPSVVHQIAQSGFGTGTNDLYDSVRPSYTPEVISLVRKAITSDGPLTIIEPGSGTGIFTRLLLSAPTTSPKGLVNPSSTPYPSFDIKTLVAVEPSDGMREAWEKGLQRLEASDPSVKDKDVRAVAGDFADFSKSGVAEGTADAVIIAQAWHWCPDYDLALREAAKYLKKGAPLILVWNLESNDDKWHKDLQDWYTVLDKGSPQYYKGLWRKCFQVPAYNELFEEVTEDHVNWAVGLTEDLLVDRIRSKSYLTEGVLNGKARQDFFKGLKERIDAPGAVWVDKEKGILRHEYVTDIFVLRRK